MHNQTFIASIEREIFVEIVIKLKLDQAYCTCSQKKRDSMSPQSFNQKPNNVSQAYPVRIEQPYEKPQAIHRPEQENIQNIIRQSNSAKAARKNQNALKKI